MASELSDESPGIPERLADLARALSARAAGVWRVEGDRLVQVAFVAGEGLAEEVARAFAEATRSVSRAEGDLGIVRAANLGVVAASRAAELPAEGGSGLWLRAFGASRSVAVPLLDARGSVHAIVSVALADSPLDDRAVADRIRSGSSGWTISAPG
jgi:hypothetical protein